MRNFVIVGSHAALHHRIIRKRVPLDYDIITSRIEGIYEFLDYIGDNVIKDIKGTEKGATYFLESGKIVEAECADICTEKWEEHTRDLFHRMREGMLPDEVFAPKEWLYLLKMSHRYKKDSPHFYKTMNDIRFMRERGCEMPENSDFIFVDRECLTYDYGHPKLNVDKDGFFKGDEVPYTYDHDSIHRAVALDGVPAYTHYIKDGEEVLCSKEKFFAATERIRLLGGLEESLVLTAERSLIPHNFKPNPDRMFKFALSKVCTSVTSGWFREYCWENAPRIMKMYQEECQGIWVDKLLKAIDNGTVLPYTGKTY